MTRATDFSRAEWSSGIATAYLDGASDFRRGVPYRRSLTERWGVEPPERLAWAYAWGWMEARAERGEVPPAATWRMSRRYRGWFLGRLERAAARPGEVAR